MKNRLFILCFFYFVAIAFLTLPKWKVKKKIQIVKLVSHHIIIIRWYLKHFSAHHHDQISILLISSKVCIHKMKNSRISGSRFLSFSNCWSYSSCKCAVWKFALYNMYVALVHVCVFPFSRFGKNRNSLFLGKNETEMRKNMGTSTWSSFNQSKFFISRIHLFCKSYIMFPACGSPGNTAFLSCTLT